jgi:1,2-phenylacetyl-CoA epoxidase PaaB subunit
VQEPQAELYEVFARHGSEPVRHVGSVRAASPEEAGVFAYTLYDERGWSELFVVPRECLLRVVSPR